MSTILDVTQQYAACDLSFCRLLIGSLFGSLSDQIKLMNSHVRPETATALLGRVIQRLGTKNVAAFNEVEAGKLSEMFKLSEAQLTDVLETCGYVFEQCAYVGLGVGAPLAKELSQLGLREELCAAFVAVWEESGAALRAALADRSICAKRLEKTDWSVHLQLGQQDATRIKKPVAVMSFATHDQDNDTRETATFELTHEQLIDFSRQLDRVQAQFDALN